MIETPVPSWRLKEEAERRRTAEARTAELETVNKAFRIALVALGADPDEIIAELDRSLPVRCPEAQGVSL